MIIGGHGKVALLTAPLLVEAGHEVTSAIRNPDHSADVEATGAASVVADVEELDKAGIHALIQGCDAVVWSAGAGGGSPERTVAVDRDAAIRTIDAATEAGVNRFVMVSYIGSGRDDIPEDNPFVHYARAKAEADDHLRASSLNWTILGPGGLTLEEPSGRIDAGEQVISGEVSRANVADVVAQAVVRDDLSGVWLPFVDGDTAVAEVLDQASS